MSYKTPKNNFCLRWQGKQKRIGITGGIASGKTSVGNFICQIKDWPAMDADIYAREALVPDSEILEKVLSRYGEQITNKDQKINRKLLAKIIFENTNERLWLEKIIHPFIRKRFNEDLEKYKSQPKVVLIIPLLFEQNYNNLCSEIWYVDCSKETQIERITKRDGLTINQANQRINSQFKSSFKKQFSDFIINNNGDSQSWKILIKKRI